MESRPLEGRLVRFRAVEPEDEHRAFSWVNDAQVTEHLGIGRYPMSHAQERQWIDGAGQLSYWNPSFAVETLDEGRHIGSTGFRDVSAENRSAEVGIMIGDTAYWDRGYGTDTMRTVCRFGFEMMNLHRIQLLVFAENFRARKVYDRLGFREEGVLRDHTYKFGRYHDHVVMGLLAGELQ